MPPKAISHIDYSIIPKTHTPMYLMHKYWARKPHNVVAEYIKHYSQEGDIVLDPFSGSGVTAIEALKLGRKAVAIDLDPMSAFITRMTLFPTNLEDFKREFTRLRDSVKQTIDQLYETTCPNCNKITVADALIWQDDAPIEIRYKCTCSKGNQWKKAGDYDFAKLKQIEEMAVPYWYPDNELIWNTRVNVHKGDRVSDLFTKRNLIALSMLYSEIECIGDENLKNIMKFTFTSSLGQSSKMVFVYRIKGRERQVGGWATRGYWTPPENFEINVWNSFENRFKKVYRGKEESNEKVPVVKESKEFDDLRKDKNVLIKTHNAQELLSVLPKESVDYVFTDPPYGDSVPYLELDYLWSSWLKFNVNFEDEIIISDSPVRKEKNFEMYQKMLRKAFRQIYSVLKKNKCLTVTFHSTDIKIYNSIISSLVLAGFDLEEVVHQPPARTSPKALLAPYGSAIGDYYIGLRKTEKESLGLAAYDQIDKEIYERIILEAVKKIIGGHGEPIAYSTIVNSYPIIYNELKQNGYLFSAPEKIEEILKRNLNKEFVLVDVKNDKGDVIGQKWWLKGVLFLDRVPLSERVEAITLDVLNRGIKVSFDEVLQEVYLKFPNGLTPDKQSVKQVLEAFAERTSDDKWRLKATIKERESEHDPIAEKVAILGKKMGFEVYADLPEWRGKLKLDLPQKNLDRIKEIDVIWHDKGEITHEFEVENSTGVIEAIVRGSNIPSSKIKRYIVIPEERQNFAYKRISEPMVSQKVVQDGWQFIFYDTLKTFYKKNKNRTTMSLLEFEKLGRMPSLKTDKQQRIEEFLQ